MCDDGVGLEESAVVCRYLDHLDGTPKFEVMRRCGAGAGNLARALPTVCDAVDHGHETSGTSMSCSSGSRGFNIICGVAVDQCGVILDILVQDRRNAIAAKRRHTEWAKLWPNFLHQ